MPVERLQAAIEKLEQYQGETWNLWPSEDAGYYGIAAANPGGGRQVVGEWVESEHDADLIVTLHRTIEAQLRVLALGATFVGDIPDAFLDLADAILGSES